MIRINKTGSQLNSIAKSHKISLWAPPFSIEAKINTTLNGNLPNEEIAYYSFLKANLSDIITASPKKLENLKSKIDPLYSNILNIRIQNKQSTLKKERRILNHEIFQIFNYGKFVSYNEGEFAYKLAETLDVPVCLYCNRQYTFTVKDKSGKTRPQFDHFYDKGTNPHFALSLYNLIPSCSICNSSLKGTDTFTISNNLHPFIEEADRILSFRIDVTKTDFVEGRKKNFKVVLLPHDGNVNKITLNKAKGNAEIFLLEKLYEKHKDIAADIIKKAYYYNRDKIKTLLQYKTDKGNNLFATKTEVLEFVFCTYLTSDKLGDRALSKFTRDIVDQLEVFKY